MSEQNFKPPPKCPFVVKSHLLFDFCIIPFLVKSGITELKRNFYYFIQIPMREEEKASGWTLCAPNPRSQKRLNFGKENISFLFHFFVVAAWLVQSKFVFELI